MSFIFGVLQYFLSSGSFAAQSLYSAYLCSYRHWQSSSHTMIMCHSVQITCNTYSSTDSLKSPIHLSDWLIFCCGNLILHQKKETKMIKT